MGRNTPDEKSGRPSSESHMRLSFLMSAELGADCLWCHNDFGKRPANEDDVYEWHYAREKRLLGTMRTAPCSNTARLGNPALP
jgi:hypothetical protein